MTKKKPITEEGTDVAESLMKVHEILKKEGSYIIVNHDIEHGTLDIQVTPKSVNDGTFDKVMVRVLDYVKTYAECVSSRHSPPQVIDPDPPDGYS